MRPTFDAVSLAQQLDLDPVGRGSSERRIRCPEGCDVGRKRSQYAASLHVGGGDKHGVWHCHRCGQGGHIEQLDPQARPVERPAKEDLPPPEPPLPMPLAWDRLMPHGDRAGLVAWAKERGWPEDVADAFAGMDDVLCAPSRGVQSGAAERLRVQAAYCRRPVLFAIRDRNGVVRSAMRRWITDPRDELGKTLGLRRDICPVEGPRILGSLPVWIECALAGERVWIVEGEPDFGALSALCRLWGWGAVIASPFAGGLVDIARAARVALGDAAQGVEIGCVPHLGDTGRTEAQHRVGLKKMSEAARLLAEVGAEVELVLLGREDEKLDVAHVLEVEGRAALEAILRDGGEPVDPHPPHFSEDPTGPPPDHEDDEAGGSDDEADEPILDSASHIVWAREVARMMGRVLYDEDALWRYEAGVWERVSPRALQQMVHALDGRRYWTWGRSGERVTRPIALRGEVGSIAHQVGALDGILHEGFFAEDRPGLNFRNGFLEVTAAGAQLVPHSPGQASRWQLGWAWDEDATAPTWLDAVRYWVWPDVTRWDDATDAPPFDPEEDAEAKALFLQEFAGACLLGIATRYAVCAMLPGRGRNGKTVFIETLLSLFPEGAQAGISPHQFGGSTPEYFLARMSGVRINAATEVPDSEVVSGDTFKALVSGDALEARAPAGMPFTVRCRAGHIFAANKLPPVRDQSLGWWRRFMLVRFDQEIPEAEADVNLGSRLRGLAHADTHAGQVGERPGITRWAIDGAVRLLRQGGYTTPPSSTWEKERWMRSANSVATWVDEETQPTDDASEMITSKKGYDHYKEWARENTFSPVNSRNWKDRMCSLLQLKKPLKLPRGHGFPVRLAGGGI